MVDVAETLVVDDEEGIDFLGEQVKAVESLVDLLLAFEKEGDGHDTDREDAFLLGFVGDDRRCTGSCAAAHTCGDEHHAGVGIK